MGFYTRPILIWFSALKMKLSSSLSQFRVKSGMAISDIRSGRRQHLRLFQRHSGTGYLSRFRFKPSSFRKNIWLILFFLAVMALLPPLFFHFKLRRFQQIRSSECGWIKDPPLVCAHGGDSTNAFPNTMDAYEYAIRSQADCIEIDVSRSSDGALFALHDRDLQRISGNSTLRVGHLTRKQIKELDASHLSTKKSLDHSIPTVEDALMLISKSVRQVILDVKVGPPSHEKGLAKDILSVIEKSQCKNCIVWAKSDSLVRDIIKLSSDIAVGYIVLVDSSTGVRNNLLRMKGASVVGVYHPLIDGKLIRVLHRRKKRVYAWTVDDVDSQKRMLFEQVDAVVTGNPTLLQGLMQDLRTQCLEEGF